MQRVYLPLENEQFSPGLLGWIDLLHTLGPLRLTASVSAGLAEKESLCRCAVRKLERFCVEKDIRLAVNSEPPADPDLVLLEGAGCVEDRPGPVLSLRGTPFLPGELILLYDGSPASREAIERFGTLFPSFGSIPATLVYFNNDPAAPIPDEWAMRIMGARLFRRFRVVKMAPRTRAFYEAWLGMMSNPWIVVGASQRDELADSMHSAIAAELVSIREMPAFAA
ncbi:MAG TPA: hypothetical protein VN616_12195 [Puia sp.]|nr:hypothetical protein [Puia sp.]